MAITVDNADKNRAFKKAVRLLSCEGLDGAKMVVERELEAHPDSSDALVALADILYLQGMHERALRCAERSLKANSDNALAYHTKGNVLYKLGRYEEAIDCYNRAIEIDPLLVRAWHNKKLATQQQLRKICPKVSIQSSREYHSKTAR